MNGSTLTVRVARRSLEAEGIVSFELTSVDGKPLPPFSAGSHIDVTVRSGLVRQYSLCNESDETHRYLIGVLRDPASRGGSRGMHEQVREGDLLKISAPKNHFALAAGAQRSILVAGGIGVTPILCMAERLFVSGGEFEMHYCARSVERMAFRKRILASGFSRNVQFHFDDGPPEQRLDIASLVAAPQTNVHLYVCGPKGFMDAVLSAARANSWPESHLHYEFFAGEAAKSDGGTDFEVRLASSGRVIAVPKGTTIIHALARVGVNVPVSCEQGVCGTCLTRVLEGIPEHKDAYLTPEEQALNDQLLPCCSRSLSPVLVLDL